MTPELPFCDPISSLMCMRELEADINPSLPGRSGSRTNVESGLMLRFLLLLREFAKFELTFGK